MTRPDPTPKESTRTSAPAREFREAHGSPDTWSAEQIEDYLDLAPAPARPRAER